LIKSLKQCADLNKQLNITKDSTNKIIQCYNMKLNVTSHTIARTIIEMVVREHVQEVCLSVENLMIQFREQKGYSVTQVVLPRP